MKRQLPAPRRWTPTEDAYLRKHASTKTRKKIGHALKRNSASVNQRMIRLGLRGYAPLAWSEEDKALALQFYPTMPSKELAIVIGKSYSAMRGFLSYHGARKTDLTVWTQRHRRYLERWYNVKPIAEIAEHFGIPWHIVRHYAHKLGLRRPRLHPDHEWTAADKKLMRQLYGRATNEALAKKIGVTNGALKHQASRMGLAGRRVRESKKQSIAPTRKLRRD